ncbi:hypothetical protein MTO96_035999 [Rhipicephalus appendiculatus]
MVGHGTVSMHPHSRIPFVQVLLMLTMRHPTRLWHVDGPSMYAWESNTGGLHHGTVYAFPPAFRLAGSLFTGNAANAGCFVAVRRSTRGHVTYLPD